MVLYSIPSGNLMGFYSDLMEFYSNSMGFYSDLIGYEWDIPSGNLTQLLKMTQSKLWIFPLKMVIFHSHVKFLEGSWNELV